ncbi:uncharacterized protein LOC119555021 [Drosophila subpulchrella]|uniref:uncharacterized protein LOC119555021 n=1 Tax=Drosophila subpulchrella TaxID=1486046 RepID=UPI0018A16FC8|nr:uncharacterized protein LOC119555021 [Drosophila subpulchrella]
MNKGHRRRGRGGRGGRGGGKRGWKDGTGTAFRASTAFRQFRRAWAIALARQAAAVEPNTSREVFVSNAMAAVLDTERMAEILEAAEVATTNAPDVGNNRDQEPESANRMVASACIAMLTFTGTPTQFIPPTAPSARPHSPASRQYNYLEKDIDKSP